MFWQVNLKIHGLFENNIWIKWSFLNGFLLYHMPKNLYNLCIAFIFPVETAIETNRTQGKHAADVPCVGWVRHEVGFLLQEVQLVESPVYGLLGPVLSWQHAHLADHKPASYRLKRQKKSCLYPLTWPTLFFFADPKLFVVVVCQRF